MKRKHLIKEGFRQTHETQFHGYLSKYEDGFRIVYNPRDVKDVDRDESEFEFRGKFRLTSK